MIGKIDKTKLTHTAADWPAKQRKGRGGRVPSTPPDGKNTIVTLSRDYAALALT